VEVYPKSQVTGSAIEDLARICCARGKDWSDVLMGLMGSFDASGDESSQLIMVVAGFVSSAKDWGEFSEKWVERLKRDGITCWHMKEFSGSQGEFSHLKGDEPRRRALQSDLMDLIISHTYRKFGIVVTNETFRNTITQQTRDEWHLNAYSLAGRSCAKQINEWMLEEPGFRSSSLALVFEEGDVGAGKLHNRLVEDGYQAPDFRPKRDQVTPEGVLKPAFVPLQVADWLANEVFLEVKRMGEADRIHDTRWGLIQFDARKPGVIGTYKVEDLREFQNMAEMSKKMDEWALSTGLLKKTETGRLYREVRTLTCDLHLFTWSDVETETGQPGIKPFCKGHSDSVVSIGKSGDHEIVVTCRHKGGEHVLNMCSESEFEAEREEARATFEKYRESKSEISS
jgi:hypothetical protein